jgi:predicted membrane protein
MDFPFFPPWLFTWPMILIAVGLYSGIKHQFRNPGWIIMIIVGSVFLADHVNMGFNLHRFIIPIAIISVGLIMIVRPRRNHDWRWQDWDKRKSPTASTATQDYTSNPSSQDYSYSSQDYFDSTAIFGNTKKIILSKNFQGGDITCIFGGCEVDLSKADVQKPAVIDLTFVFGGGKIIVPSNWQVDVRISPVFGGVEDKRQQPLVINPDKILIIKGTCFFGGLEIKNF